MSVTRAQKVTLPQPVALRLEIARAGGLSEEALLGAIREKRIDALQRFGPEQLSWDILSEYADEYPDDLERAIREGYAFKFLTIRGLTSYLRYRFGLHEKADYRLVEEGLDGVRLEQSDIALLKGTIPAFWLITETGAQAEEAIVEQRSANHPDLNKVTIRIERLHYHANRFEGGDTK